MTGGEIKTQAMVRLRKRGDEADWDAAEDLAPCVVLTPEEAEHIYHDLCLGQRFDRPFKRSRALLTPEVKP
jgi:hypothetical protein